MLDLTQLTGFNARRGGALHKRGRGTAGIMLGAVNGAFHKRGSGTAGIVLEASGVGFRHCVGSGTAGVTFETIGTGDVINYNPGTEDLVYWWDFDGDYFDAVAEEEFSVSSGVAFSGGITGTNCVRISTDGLITYTEPRAIMASLPSTGTLCFWVRGINIQNAFSSSDFWFDVPGYSSDRLFRARVDLVNFKLLLGDYVAFDQTLDLSTWYFVTLKWDGTNTGFYINGTLIRTAENVSVYSGQPVSWWSNNLHPPIHPYYLNKTALDLDALAVFDTLLTNEEVGWLYNEGAGRSFADL